MEQKKNHWFEVFIERLPHSNLLLFHNQINKQHDSEAKDFNEEAVEISGWEERAHSARREREGR